MSKAEELAKKLGKEIERTVAHDVLMQDALTHLRALDASHQRLKEALEDMNNGWKYIRRMHGNLYGVGWDRAQGKADAALEQAKDLS